MNLLREKFCKETNTPMGLDNIYDYCIWLEKKHKTDVINAFENGKYNSHKSTSVREISGVEYFEKEFNNN